MCSIKVYIADDHQMLIDGLSLNFSKVKKPTISVIGNCTDTDTLLKDAKRKDIDVFILDLAFYSTVGDISIVRKVLEINPKAKIVVYSQRRAPESVTGCYQNGAMAYIPKTTSFPILLEAIEAVSKGQEYYDPRLLETLGMSVIKDPLHGLSNRDKELFLMLAHERPIEEIEEKLGLSERSINNIATNRIKPVVGVTKSKFRSAAIKLGLLEDLS